MTERKIPSSLDAERAILGACLLDPSCWLILRDEVNGEDFHREAHRQLWGLISEVNGKGERPTCDSLVAVDLAVQRGHETYGGAAYISGLPEGVPSTQNIEIYAALLRDRALRRRAIVTAHELLEGAYQGEDVSDVLAQGEKALQRLAGSSVRDEWRTQADVVDRCYQLKAERTAALMHQAVAGASTGFPKLDAKTGGLRGGDLIVLAARPAMGKSALALNIARKASEHITVAVVNQEMIAEQCVDRQFASEARVNTTSIRNGILASRTDDHARMADAAEALHGLPIHWLDVSCTVSRLRSLARRLKAREPNLGLLVVDYLQLLEAEDRRQNREQQVAGMSRGLKLLAKELKICVLLLSQLNRGVEMRENKRPRMADLRESGAIEQDADMVIFIYREEEYNPDTEKRGLAEVIVSKNRHGPKGTVEMGWSGEYQTFSDLGRRHEGLYGGGEGYC